MVTQMEHCPPKLPSNLQGLWVVSALPRHDAHEVLRHRFGVAWWLHIMGSEACLRKHSRESELPHGVAQILAPKAERRQTHLRAHRNNALWRASAKATCHCLVKGGRAPAFFSSKIRPLLSFLLFTSILFVTCLKNTRLGINSCFSVLTIAELLKCVMALLPLSSLYAS